MAVLDIFPEIAEAMIERDWEIMSHGLFNTRFLFGLSRDEEGELIRGQRSKPSGATPDAA